MNKWIAEFDLEDGDTMPEHMDLEYKGARIDFHCRPLEQEPTTKNNLGVDCIARQDVERYIEGFINEYTPKEELEFINLELDGLKHIPSVTPQEPRWIPVSEKLPKPFTYVNATCRSLVDDRENWVIETVYLPVSKEVNKHGYSDWGNLPMLNLGEAEVIAWVERVIPQPYKAEVEPQESEE